MQVVDYSFSHPDPAAIAAAGFVGAVRYLSNGQPPKDLTPAERDELHAAGALLALVFETAANRAGQGRDAGARDAMRANQLADALDWPADRPIRYAVDFQATWAQVRDYFDGARSTGGRPVSVYGCYDVIEGAAAEGYGWLWQCAAWSGNGSGSGGSIQGRRVSAHAALFQRVGYVLGDSSDVNDVLADDWGGWHPNQPVPVPLPPIPLGGPDVQFFFARDKDTGTISLLGGWSGRPAFIIRACSSPDEYTWLKGVYDMATDLGDNNLVKILPTL